MAQRAATHRNQKDVARTILVSRSVSPSVAAAAAVLLVWLMGVTVFFGLSPLCVVLGPKYVVSMGSNVWLSERLPDVTYILCDPYRYV